jgi:hypothetical protein
MKYYDEEKMHDLRLQIEKEILTWPNVTTKKMFGCPCYKYKDKLFAFLVTEGIVLTKLNEKDKRIISEEFMIKPFQALKRKMKNWPQIPLNKKSDIKKIISIIKKCYYESKSL